MRVRRYRDKASIRRLERDRYQSADLADSLPSIVPIVGRFRDRQSRGEG